MVEAFQEPKNYENQTTESGLKHRFSLLEEKVFIQAVCPKDQAVSITAWFYILSEAQTNTF